MRRRVIALVAVAVVVGGCTAHRAASPLEPLVLPDAFREAAAPGSGEVGPWWHALGDADLDRLVEAALAHNQDLAAATANLKAAEAAAVAAGATLRPTLDANGRVSRTSRPGFFGTDIGTSYNLSLAAGYEIDLWHRLRSTRDAARESMEVSRNDLATLRITTAARVADLYLLAVEARAQLALLDRTIASFAESEQTVAARYRAGIAAALDLYQARQALAAARTRRPAVARGLSQAEHGLAVLVGQTPEVRVAGDRTTLPEPPPTSPVGLPADLLIHRPDLAAALARVRVADARVAAAIAARLPGLRLTANLGRSSTAFSSGAIVGRFWDIAAGLTAPLIDGGRLRAEARQRQAERQAVAATFRATLLRALQEVEDALTANATSEVAVARTVEGVEATAATLRAAEEGYRQGVSDYLPILTAQQAHLTAESDLLAAGRQRLADRITLARVLGGVWAPTPANDGAAGSAAIPANETTGE